MRRTILLMTAFLTCATAAGAGAMAAEAGAWPGVRWREPGPIAPSRLDRAPVAEALAVPAATSSPTFKLLTGTAILQGHVFDLAGAPLANANVGWIVDGATVSKASKATNESGAYSFANVPAASGNGTVWASPASGAWELARLGASWPDPGTSTFDFAPAGLPTTLVRGGPWDYWPSAWVSVYGTDDVSALAAGAEYEGVWDEMWEEYQNPTYGDTPTLPGLFDLAAVNFWANEGIEVTFSARSGPGARRSQSPITQAAHALSFPDHEHGWVISQNTVAATSDGGLTWHTQYQGPAYLYDIDFADALDGIAVGVDPEAYPNGKVFAMWTDDGGVTWTPSESGLMAEDDYQELRGVALADASHAWAVGQDGKIFATSDGGRNWTAQVSGTTQFLESVTFADLRHGWASGRGEIILATTDGGATWTTQHELTDSHGAEYEWLEDIAAVDASHAWTVAHRGRALLTTDGGVTWQPMHPTSGTSSDHDYEAIEFVDTQHGWLVGQGPGLMMTSDGGLTWTPQAASLASSIAIDMDSLTSGWVLGSWGGLLDTVDGGAQWGPRSLVISEADALRVFTTAPWSASGAPGMRVTLDLQQFPAGWTSTMSGYSAYPTSAPVTPYGSYTSLGGVDETVSMKVPAKATPGYAYWIRLQHEGGPLSLETAVQVCRFKSSAGRVVRGRTVTLSGIVPTKGHWGRTAGKAKTVYLFKRFTKRGQPTTGDPTKQGWRYVGQYRTNGYGVFSAKGVKIGRATWFVVLYPGDSWYWAGYTGVVTVGVR